MNGRFDGLSGNRRDFSNGKQRPHGERELVLRTVKNSTPTSLLAGLGPDEILATSAWLRTLALALVRDSHDAEDLVQSALGAAAASKADALDTRGYLAGTVRRMALKMHRTRIRRADHESLRAQDEFEESRAPDRSLEALEMMEMTLREISLLPDVQARSISLRYVEGLEVREIAQRLGSSPSTVRSNLARGMATLRAQLDARHGDRSAWAAVLIPVAFPREAASAAVPQTALPKLLAGTMIYKLAVIAAVPLFFIGRSYLTESPIEPVAPATVSQADEPLVEVAVEGAIADATTTRQLASVPDAGPRVAGAASPSRAESPVAPRELRSREIAFVDGHTMEPIPHFEVTLALLDAEGSPLPSWSADKPTWTTDARGQIQLEDLPALAASIQIRETPRSRGSLPAGLAVDIVPAEDDAPRWAFVGPTFRFRFTGHAPQPGSDLYVLAQGPGIAELMLEVARVEWGETPWARFPELLGSGEGTGPWILTIHSGDGFHWGSAQVTRGKGIEPELVHVEFQARGSVRFETNLPEAPGTGTGPIIDLTFVGTDVRERVRMHAHDQGLRGDAQHLAPGDYEWSSPGQVDSNGAPVGGQVHVAVGQTAVVQVPAIAGPNAARFAVVDATAAPGADLAELGCVIVDTADIESAVMPTPERAPDLGHGMWRIPVGPVPQAGWLLSIDQLDGYEISPEILTLPATAELPVIRLTPTVAGVHVQLILFDETTGRVLTGVDRTEALHFDGFRTRPLVQAGTQGFASIEVSSVKSTRFVCRARGYRSTAVDFEPGNSSAELRVALRPGWRNYVIVLNSMTMLPEPGVAVLVEGTKVGTTNERGELWLDLEAAPGLIELAFEDETLGVALTPFDRPDQLPGDPLRGYSFLVKPR